MVLYIYLMPIISGMFNKTVRNLIHITKLIYTPVSLVFVLYFSWTNKELLYKLITVSDLRLIVIAVVLWSSLCLVSTFLTRKILAVMSCNISYAELLKIYIRRLPARYVPGGIWHTVGRLSDYHLHGVSKRNLSILAAIETIFPAIITFFVGGGWLWLMGTSSLLNRIEGALSMISLSALLTVPLLMKRWRGGYFVWEYLLFVAASIFFWLIASVAFVCYYYSLTPYSQMSSGINVAFSYIFSWGVGYVSIFAPQGFGVFELVAGKLMSLPMSIGEAVVFTAGFRVVILLADFLVCGLLYIRSLMFHPSFPQDISRRC